MARMIFTANLRRCVDWSSGRGGRGSQGDHWLEVSHTLPPAHAVRFAPAG
jgi:hypothetical protein